MTVKILRANLAMAKKASIRSPMSLAACGKRQRGPCTDFRAMTGLGAVDSGRVPINRHVRPACSPSPKHSRNGLHDTLQRALGPDLGHKQLPRLFTVCCYLPSTLSPTATKTSATRSVFVQVTAPHDLRRRHTAAYAKDSSP